MSITGFTFIGNAETPKNPITQGREYSVDDSPFKKHFLSKGDRIESNQIRSIYGKFVLINTVNDPNDCAWYRLTYLRCIYGNEPSVNCMVFNPNTDTTVCRVYPFIAVDGTDIYTDHHVKNGTLVEIDGWNDKMAHVRNMGWVRCSYLQKIQKPSSDEMKVVDKPKMPCQVLLQHRGPPPHVMFSGKICFPGGSFDIRYDKNSRDTAIREGLEEAGVIVNPGAVVTFTGSGRSCDYFVVNIKDCTSGKIKHMHETQKHDPKNPHWIATHSAIPFHGHYLTKINSLYGLTKDQEKDFLHGCLKQLKNAMSIMKGHKNPPTYTPAARNGMLIIVG